jgi:hypothetical protein
MWDVDIVHMRSENCVLRKFLTYRSLCKDSGGNSAENISVYSKFPKIINDNINSVYKVYLNSSYYKVLLDYLRVSTTLTPSLVFPGHVFTMFRTIKQGIIKIQTYV